MDEIKESIRNIEIAVNSLALGHLDFRKDLDEIKKEVKALNYGRIRKIEDWKSQVIGGGRLIVFLIGAGAFWYLMK